MQLNLLFKNTFYRTEKDSSSCLKWIIISCAVQKYSEAYFNKFIYFTILNSPVQEKAHMYSWDIDLTPLRLGFSEDDPQTHKIR